MGAMLNLLLADDFVGGLLNILSLIMMIADAALVAYAVYMFFMMMTASDEGKRRNVKKHFFNTLSSILIILALIGTLSVIKVNITQVEQDTSGGGGAVGTLGGTVQCAPMYISKGQRLPDGTYQCNGSVTINSNSDIKLKETGVEIDSIKDFTVLGSAAGFPQNLFTTGKYNNKGVTITYKNSVKEVDMDGAGNYVLLLRAESTAANNPAIGYIKFSVSVSGKNSSGARISGTVVGTLELRSEGGFVLFG